LHGLVFAAALGQLAAHEYHDGRKTPRQ
jgi:hypothetical protein